MYINIPFSFSFSLLKNYSFILFLYVLHVKMSSVDRNAEHITSTAHSINTLTADPNSKENIIKYFYLHSFILKMEV